MWFLSRSRAYTQLETSELDNDFELERIEESKAGVREVQTSPRRRSQVTYIVCCTALLCLTIVSFFCGVFVENRGLLAIISTAKSRVATPPSISINEPPSLSRCHDPPVRREWRSLSLAQKHEYVDAVLCLRTIPSSLNPNMSLYDDFPFLHDTIGAYGIAIIMPCSCIFAH
jgi:hypothetical protein